MSQSEIILTIENIDPISLYGERNSKLNLIRKAFPDITITSRGSQLKIVGKKSDAQEVKHKIELMVKILREHHELSVHNVEDLLQGDNPLQIQISQHENKHVLLHGREGKAIYAKTKNQLLLVKAVEENDIVFADGPSLVKNIFIWSVVEFCASSRMIKALSSVLPRINARGAISITRFSIN